MFRCCKTKSVITWGGDISGSVYQRTDRTNFIQRTFLRLMSNQAMYVIYRGMLSFMATYAYDLDGRLLSEYSMEQQAQIIADNYILTEWGFGRWNELRLYDHVKSVRALSEPEACLAYMKALRGFPW